MQSGSQALLGAIPAIAGALDGALNEPAADHVHFRHRGVAACTVARRLNGTAHHLVDPKLQLSSVEDLLEGQLPKLPAMSDPYTGKPIQQYSLFE